MIVFPTSVLPLGVLLGPDNYMVRQRGRIVNLAKEWSKDKNEKRKSGEGQKLANEYAYIDCKSLYD